MNKTAMTAVVLAFDLGIVAVATPSVAASSGVIFKFDSAGQATRDNEGSTQASTDQNEMTSTIYIKIDAVTTVEVCGVKHGKVVTKQGKQYCQLPIPGNSPSGR